MANKPGLMSMESIDFQFPLVFKQLTGVFEKLGAKSSTNDFIDAALEITDIVKHGTDMSVHLVFDTIGSGSYMIIPDLTAQHALLSPNQNFSLDNTGGLELIRKAKGAINGSVDTKKNRVTGIFKDIVLAIHMPMADIKAGYMSAMEFAAVFLHELGHGFVYFEYLNRTCTTNQVLAGLAKGLDSSDTYGNKKIMLTEIAKSVGLSSVDIDSLAATTDKRVLNMVVITALNKEYAKETGYDIYDSTANEALADQYATRMGAGRSLVTGLDKIYRKYDVMAYRTTTSYLLVEATKVSLLLLAPLFIVALPEMAAASVWVAFIGLVMIVSDATELGVAGRYDMPGDRFKRVRMQLVEKLKNRSLLASETKTISDDIATIDTVIAAVNDRRQFFGVIQDFLTSSKRFNRDMKLLQQSLEKLAANDLFVSAARLTTASKA